MRRRLLLWGSCLLALLLIGCAPKADVFAPFRAEYFAEVSGELYGMAFSATVEMAKDKGTGARASTVTFYAPDLLSGTTVRRSESGEITVSSGGLAIPDAGGIGAALFSLFPIAGEITESTLTDEGYTRVCGDSFTLILLSDGTPYEIQTAAVHARVVRWEQK